MSQTFTIAELGRKSTPELQSLFREASLTLNVTDANTPERRRALADIETISRALAHRYLLSP